MQKIRFLDILVLLKLDLGQISFNPVENAFATQQLALLATSITFYHIVTRACDFWNFFRLPFFAFSVLFAAVIDLLLGLLVVKKTSKKASSRRENFSMEQPGVVAGNFALSFSLNVLSIFVHI